MNKILLSLSLITSFALSAGECSRSETSDEFESPIAYMDEIDNNGDFDQSLNDYSLEISEYNKKLTEYLENSRDINIQLAAYLSSYEHDDSKNKLIKNTLKRAINIDADKYTIYLADNLCHSNDKITSWCHKQKIHQIHTQIDPENVMTYLFNIHQEDNREDIQDIILIASQNSTYSSLYYNQYTLKIAQQMIEFNESFPLLYSDSLNDKDNYISQIKISINENDFRNKGLLTQDLDTAINEVSPIFEASVVSMMMISPPSTFFIRYCQSPIDADDCVDISNILLSDKALINKGIGLQLLSKSKELRGEDYEKDNMDTTYTKLMCYMQSKDTQVVAFINKGIVVNYIKDSKKYGDLEAAKRMSYTIYNIEKQNGFNPDFDPKDCE